MPLTVSWSTFPSARPDIKLLKTDYVQPARLGATGPIAVGAKNHRRYRAGIEAQVRGKKSLAGLWDKRGEEGASQRGKGGNNLLL